MVARAREFVVVAVLGAVAVLEPVVRAQGPSAAPPPAPVSVVPGTTYGPPAPIPGHLDPGYGVSGADLTSAPHPPPAVAPSGLPPLPDADPGRNGWGPYGPPSPDPAVFFDVDLQVLRPVLKNRLQNDTPLPGGAIIQLPTADQDWTVSPLFEVGYRLPDSLGLVALAYRFLATDGSRTQPGDGAPLLRSRLEYNVVDIDYGTNPYAVAPFCDWQWRVGVRYATAFFDSRLADDVALRQTSNFFTGAGPHARLDLSGPLKVVPGLALFGRIDGSLEIGRTSQKFRNGVTLADGTQASESLEQNSTQVVPILQLQAGVSYTPPTMCNVHFTTGYQFEKWWYVGQMGESDINGAAVSASRGEFYTQGLFFRGEIDF